MKTHEHATRSEGRSSPFGPAFFVARRGAVISTAALLMAGCASSPSSPPPAISANETPTLPAPPSAETREIRLSLGADLKRCHPDEPHFFYDGTEVRAQDTVVLRALADCLNQPGFSDVDLRLIGRADPRGSDEYNEELSRGRAERVRELLVKYGVDGERISVEAEGEEKAIGDSEDASYGYDRRVEIVELSVITP